MPTVTLGPWTPDFADIRAPGAQVAQNCLPAQEGFREMKGPAPLSGAVPGSNDIRGLWQGQDAQGNGTMFVGTDAEIYAYNRGTNSFDDVSRAGGYGLAIDARWSVTQFGDGLIAAGWQNEMQRWTLGTSTQWADIAGAPKARYVTVCRDFVVAAYIDDADGVSGNRVRWSALGDATDWTPSADTLADFQDFNELGEIRGITGGNFLTILFEQGLVRGTFVGPPQVFQFQSVEQSSGALVPGSVIQVEGQTYYFGQGGLLRYDGGGIQHIGEEIVDQHVFRQLKFDQVDSVSAVYDPVQQAIFWLYPGSNSSAGVPNKMLAYSPHTGGGRFSEVIIDGVQLGLGSTSSYNVDNVPANLGNVDSGLPSPDARFWRDSAILAGIVGTDRVVNSFAGQAMTATLRTQEAQPFADRRAIVERVLPVIESELASVQVRALMRDNSAHGGSATPLRGPQFDGWHVVDAEARYLALEAVISGGDFHATGFEIEPRRSSRR